MNPKLGFPSVFYAISCGIKQTNLTPQPKISETPAQNIHIEEMIFFVRFFCFFLFFFVFLIFLFFWFFKIKIVLSILII